MKNEEKSRPFEISYTLLIPMVSIDTEDKLEAFFSKDEIQLITDVVDDALGLNDDYENITRIKVWSSDIADDRMRITIEQHISSTGTLKLCGYSIQSTELFKSINRDFIFLIKPKLLTIDAIERKEV